MALLAKIGFAEAAMAYGIHLSILHLWEAYATHERCNAFFGWSPLIQGHVHESYRFVLAHQSYDLVRYSVHHCIKV